jgi:ABC-2 type transport system permease protein
MLRMIVFKELREVLRDRRLSLGLAAAAAALAFAAASSRREAAAVGRDQAEAQRAARENWLNLGSRDPHGAAHHGSFAFKPKSPLAPFDPGLDPYLGTSVRLEAHKQHRAVGPTAADTPDPMRFAASTPAPAVQVLLPLIVVLVGFSAVSGERERGTLPLLLSVGIAPRSLILGKALALSLIVAALALPAACLVGAALAESPNVDLAARSAVLFAAYAAYLGGWVFFTAAVSSRSRSSRASLSTLLLVWAATTLIVPRLATEVARRLHPLPTQEEFEARAKRAQRTEDGKNKFSEIYKDLEAKLLKEHGVEKKEDLPINFEGASMLAAEEFTDKVHDEVNASLEATFRSQDEAVDRWAFASPPLAIRAASAGLSGTDRAHHEAFGRAAEENRRHLVRTMNEELLHRPPKGKKDHPGRALWERVQDFRFEPPPGHPRCGGPPRT